jgi:hypothetical protein
MKLLPYDILFTTPSTFKNNQQQSIFRLNNEPNGGVMREM